MKTFLFTIIALTCIISAKAQKSDTLRGLAADTLIFVAVQQPPEFVGGQNKFGKYLAHTIRYPSASFLSRTQGKVIITMIVEKDGSLSHLKVTRSVAEDIDKEALRAMNISPKWKPGMQNGKPVRVQYSVPISFSLSN